MNNYEIGYYNHKWNNTGWTVLATAVSKSIAQTIVDAMNKKYEDNGLSMRVVLK